MSWAVVFELWEQLRREAKSSSSEKPSKNESEEANGGK